MIEFLVEDVKIPSVINDGIKDWISHVINNHLSTVGDISFKFCSDEYILQINNQFLDHDYYTDIITFDYCSRNIISGDILISVDTVSSNAEKYSSSFDKELLRVIIHGVLHLLGFKDSTAAEKEEMRSEENMALSLLPTFN